MKMKSILRYKNCNKGFTIIELMLVIVIAAIIATFGLGSFLTARANWLLRDDVGALVSNLERARMEAIRKNRPVIVEIDFEGRTYVAYINLNNNANYDDDTDTLVAQGSFNGRTRFSGGGNNLTFVFNSRGAVATNPVPAFPVFTNNKEAYTVSVNRLGFISNKHADVPEG